MRRWRTSAIRRGVGIARYIRDADDPQDRGLGTELVAQLAE